MNKFILLISFLLFCCIGLNAQKNVLFVVVDDLNDFTGFLGGHPDAKTPNLDRLAAQSVVFTKTYAAAHSCNPARAAMLTGVRPDDSGIFLNGDGFFRDYPNMVNTVTMPQYFKNNGYESVATGKIFHRQRGGNAEPFVESDTLSWSYQRPGGVGANGPVAAPLHKLPLPVSNIRTQALDMDIEATQDWMSAKYVADFLAEPHDKPFFMACGIKRPHLPWFAPKDFFELYDTNTVTVPTVKYDDLDDVPFLDSTYGLSFNEHPLVTPEDWRKSVVGYLACVSFADSCVGVILDALDTSPHKNNTVVVLIGDHGFHLGEKMQWRKFTLWEEATRAPMIIYDPSLNTSGVCDKVVSLQDLYPTLIDLCGLPARTDIAGRKLTKYIADPNDATLGYALTSSGTNTHAIRVQDWRMIKYSEDDYELYDHSVDPNEWTNLAGMAEYETVQSELQTLMDAVLAGNNEPTIPTFNDDNATEEVKINIYPNPASEQFFVNLNTTTDITGRIEIRSTDGKLILQKQIDNTINTIKITPTTPLASGCYIVSWISNSETQQISQWICY